LQNSQGIEFDKIASDNPASVLFSVNGEKSKNISVKQPAFAKYATKTSFNFGAGASSIDFK
jgi:hypothetical protein